MNVRSYCLPAGQRVRDDGARGLLRERDGSSLSAGGGLRGHARVRRKLRAEYAGLAAGSLGQGLPQLGAGGADMTAGVEHGTLSGGRHAAGVAGEFLTGVPHDRCEPAGCGGQPFSAEGDGRWAVTVRPHGDGDPADGVSVPGVRTSP
jgi:hypothetical protein